MNKLQAMPNMGEGKSFVPAGEAVEKTVTGMAAAFLANTIENGGVVFIPPLGIKISAEGVFETPITEAES